MDLSGQAATPCASVHKSATRNGKQLDTACFIVFEVENGRMLSAREHFFDLNNWDGLWS
jgi:ketosteroid isomerase-like protein